MHWREVLSHLFRSFSRHSMTVFLTLLVLSGLYGLFGLGALAAFNFRDLMGRWGDHIEMSVTLDNSLSPQQTEQISQQLKSLPQVVGLSFISTEEERKQFATSIADYAPELAKDSEFESAFSPSYSVKVDQSSSTADIHHLGDTIRSIKGVSDVSYGQEWISNFNHFAAAAQKLGLIFLAVFSLAGFFVIGNLQRMSISERIDEIEILELIGATASRIRAPFLFEGATIGFLASLIGLAGCAALFAVQRQIFEMDLPFLDVLSSLRFLSTYEAIAFCGAGTALGFLGSWFATRHIRDSWFAARRKQEV